MNVRHFVVLGFASVLATACSGRTGFERWPPRGGEPQPGDATQSGGDVLGADNPGDFGDARPGDPLPGDGQGADPSGGDPTGGDPGCVATCNSHDPCIVDTCDGLGHCVHTPSPGPCNDGVACTVGDTCVAGVCTSGAWTGVDCANLALPIYRSVGAGSTLPLATASLGGLNIRGWTARFSSPLPDNVGVGDLVVYDANGDGTRDARAFIHARTSSTEYTVRNAAGSPPLPTTADTHWQVLRAYTSLLEAENGDENPGIDAALRDFDTWTGGADLVTNHWQWNLACYADALDTTYATLEGWTTSASSFLKVYTPVSPAEVGTPQRHHGNWGMGYQHDAGIEVHDDFVWLDGLAIRTTNASDRILLVVSGNNGWVRVSNTFSWLMSATSNERAFDVWDEGAAAGKTLRVDLWNCIGVSDSTNAGAKAFYANNNQATFNIYNCTGAANGGIAFDVGGLPTAVCKNCLAVATGTATGFSGAWTEISTSASTDATADDAGGAGNRISQTFGFFDVGTQNYHLSVTDAGARGFGANLTTDPTLSVIDDIDGDPRPSVGAWDIGADQY